MDVFGIGQAMKAIANVYVQSARRTGRTTALLDSLKDGDRIGFVEPREASRVESLCRARGLKVECIVLNPAAPDRVLERGPSTGRTVFDHSLVEQLYLKAIEDVTRGIAELQKLASASDAQHLDAPLRPEFVGRWR